MVKCWHKHEYKIWTETLKSYPYFTFTFQLIRKFRQAHIKYETLIFGQAQTLEKPSRGKPVWRRFHLLNSEKFYTAINTLQVLISPFKFVHNPPRNSCHSSGNLWSVQQSLPSISVALSDSSSSRNLSHSQPFQLLKLWATGLTNLLKKLTVVDLQ